MAINKKASVVIIEDHSYYQNKLQEVLKKYGLDVVVTDCFFSTQSARSIIESGEVDGVFLDIHIAGEGLEAGLKFGKDIKKRMGQQAPWIIYWSSHSHHLPETKDTGVFLTKEFTPEEIEEALRKVIGKGFGRKSIHYSNQDKVATHYMNAGEKRYEGVSHYDVFHICEMGSRNAHDFEEPEKNREQAVKGDYNKIIYLKKENIEEGDKDKYIVIKNVKINLDDWLDSSSPFIAIRKKALSIVNMDYVAEYREPRNDTPSKGDCWAIVSPNGRDKAETETQLVVSKDCVPEFKAECKKRGIKPQ